MKWTPELEDKNMKHNVTKIFYTKRKSNLISTHYNNKVQFNSFKPRNKN